MALTRVFVAVLTALLPLFPVVADDPFPDVPCLITSAGRDYLFKMVPAAWKEVGQKYIVDRPAFGIAYHLEQDGELKEIWRTSGWYARQGYLSDDGRYFVRFGPWARDLANHTDLAIAFYDNGKLLKQFEVRELVKKLEMLEYSASHYMWNPEVQTKPNGFYNSENPIFHLVTIDQIAYAFDFKTGEIVANERDEKAKGHGVILTEDRIADQKRGVELLNNSPLKELYEGHFKISDVEAMRGIYSGCSLEGKTWTANLKPKKALRHAAEVCVVFPIQGDKMIFASLTPQDMLKAFDLAFEHPFVTAKFATGGATRLRMRTQGDRLHWDTPELIEFLTKVTGVKPLDEKLAQWAYFILDASDPRYTSFYFNTDTREIILEDKSKWPHEPYMVNRAGNRVAKKK